MSIENRTFTLVGRFDDKITKSLQKVNKQILDLQKLVKSFGKDVTTIGKGFNTLSKDLDKAGNSASKSFNKMTSSLEDSARAAGKVRDTVSQIGEGVKGLDGISESLEGAARAAGRAQEEVAGIGEAAGRANRQADDLMTTLLKANALSKAGDAMAQGFNRGMSTVMGTAQKGAGIVAKTFKEAMDDELADVKAASGIQGSFGLAGFKGSYNDAEKMYKAYDRQVSEMIRLSAAPTAKVVELQRYTLDTMGPLMLAAQGVKKGTAMKDIDPKKIEASAKQYGQFLEKAALFSQGTGSAGFRVASGIEGLVTRGKIDTTIDFFTDNIMLMKNLEKAGFAGRGMKSPKLMNATDAQRMAAMMEAFNKSMSSESTAAMAQSLTGSLQGLQDTIFNPSAGILGMAVTFTKKEQGNVNSAIKMVYDRRIAAYQKELQDVTIDEKRKEQLRNDIEQATVTRDKLIKDGADKISTPFKAFSFAFTNLVQGLTNALSAIGPVWSQFAVGIIEFTDKVFGPLTTTLRNVASDMRAKDVTQAEGFGRIVGEIFKTVGEIMGDLATMLTDPKGAMGKIQSEFMKGFMAAFKEPGSLEKARENLQKGIWALFKKIGEVLLSVLSSAEARPFVLTGLALAFGPPFISAVIAGATPLLITAIGKIALGLVRNSKGLGNGAKSAGMGGFLAKQFGKSGALAGKVPGMAGLGIGLKATANAGKMKGVGMLAAALVTLSTQAPMLGKVAKTVTSIGRNIPLLNVAFAGLDYGVRTAGGESKKTAAGGAVGGLIGGGVGAFLGSFAGPVGTVLGGVVGTWVGDWIGTRLPKFLEDGSKKVVNTFTSVKKAMVDLPTNVGNFFKDLPENINKSLDTVPGKLKTTGQSIEEWAGNIVTQIGALTRNTENKLNEAGPKTDTFFADIGTKIVNLGSSIGNNIQWFLGTMANAQIRVNIWFATNLPKFGQWATGLIGTLAGVQNRVSAWISNPSSWGKLVISIQQGFTSALARLKLPDLGAWLQQKFSLGYTPKPDLNGDGKPGWTGSLGDAISSETANKPPGSDLVIANSSETIIPAAGGLGMKDFMSTLTGGFSQVATLISRTSQQAKLREDQRWAQNNTRLTSLQQQLTKMATTAGGSMFGTGGPGGNVIGVGKQLLAMGLQVGENPFFQYGSGYLPSGGGRVGKHAQGSYHYQGRALDVSGPSALLDQAYASLKGTNPSELLWRVPGHYDHLHVAYALGAGNPAFFSSQEQAKAWEKKASLGNVKVSSITSRQNEFGGGGDINITAPITIHQQPGQDSEELAAIVAMRIGEVVAARKAAQIM